MRADLRALRDKARGAVRALPREVTNRRVYTIAPATLAKIYAFQEAEQIRTEAGAVRALLCSALDAYEQRKRDSHAD